MTFIHIHPTSSQLYPALVIKHSYWKWFIEIIDLPDLSMVNLPIKPELIGGIPTPLKNMSSSDWIIIPTELGKIKAMFQTTNQDIIVLVGWHPIEKVDLRDLNMVNLHEFSYETRESPVIFHINHGFPMVFPGFSHGLQLSPSFFTCTCRICSRPLTSGSETATRRSKRPGRSRALSKMSEPWTARGRLLHWPMKKWWFI